ncbi:MAG: DUF6516 family protein [Ferrovibrio sp.]|uniref:toxin-antitoxin system TumE family protein n=1 Tax=Ferrovibrio sp. TaxID=1917215 RepID=UPI00391CCC2D
MNSNKADLLLREHVPLDEASFADLVVWHLPRALPGSGHRYKYRLAYIENDVCVIRYDNEAGKGDHRHIRGRETAYAFTDPGQLQVDFWTDVDLWRRR